MLIENVYAQESAAPAGPGFELLIMLVVFFLIMYFMVIRPQSKRNKEHKKLLYSLKENDEILTTGGILGVVSKIHESFVTVEVHKGTFVKIQKASVTQVVPKGTFHDMQEPNLRTGGGDTRKK